MDELTHLKRARKSLTDSLEYHTKNGTIFTEGLIEAIERKLLEIDGKIIVLELGVDSGKSSNR